ncbi:unnamed protein product [Phaedon cochleariae]|uniref:Myosin motor domain-containing protein n=1 Tax=Phaedon cochleariae TaxID=80249 RepID=A0A9N9SHY2_PHACE|nr:unnamed protein product [Phaedon cochleariae]
MGARVWIPHPDQVWQGAELLENYNPSKPTLAVATDDGGTATLQLKSEKDLPFLRNPAILVGENDLTALSVTYPDFVPDIDTIQTYRGQALGNLDPHIFAVAEEAYTQLEREQRDQSVIVSGESGAGKTVSAKYAMRYFATVGGSVVETQVEKKVLASSPIMEGKSGAGKTVSAKFAMRYFATVRGSVVETFVEKKVLASSPMISTIAEQNVASVNPVFVASSLLPFRIFVSDHQDHFHYLNQGGSPDVNGVDDAETFEETVNALNLLGFSEKEQIDMFKVFASVLHLGNIRYLEGIIESENEQDQEGCLIEVRI